MAHRGNHRRVIRRVENGGTGDEHIRARCGDFRDVVRFHTAIDFEADVAAAGVNKATRGAQFVQRRGQKRLPAKAGIDRHDEDEVELVQHVIEVVKRRCRVEDQPRFHAVAFDELQRAVDMNARLWVEGDVVRACLGELLNQRIDG